MTDLLDRTTGPHAHLETRPGSGEGVVTHMVWVPEEVRGEMTPQAYVTRAVFEGASVQALCGHVWVPSRDPKRYPVCQACLEVYESDPAGHGDRDRLPDA